MSRKLLLAAAAFAASAVEAQVVPVGYNLIDLRSGSHDSYQTTWTVPGVATAAVNARHWNNGTYYYLGYVFDQSYTHDPTTGLFRGVPSTSAGPTSQVGYLSSGANDVTITVDFSANRSVGMLRFYPKGRSGYYTDYDAQYLDADNVWQTLVARQTVTPGNIPSGYTADKAFRDHYFYPVVAKAWRFNLWNGEGDWAGNATFGEIMFFEKSQDPLALLYWRGASTTLWSGAGSWRESATATQLIDWQSTSTAVFDAASSIIALGGGNVSAASLRFESGGHVVGSARNDGRLSLSSGSANVLAGVSVQIRSRMSGTLVKNGAGTLLLSGDATLDALSVASGELQVAGGLALPAGISAQVSQGAVLRLVDQQGTGFVANVINDGQVIFDHAAALAFSASIAGSSQGLGTVTKRGAGLLQVTGSLTAGSLAIEQGSLSVGSGGTSGAIAGPVSVASGAGLVFNRSDAVSFAGVISGAGSVTKQGGGTLTLTAANTYAGGTTVSAGRLVGTASTIRGNILNNAELELTSGTFSTNIISGSGILEKTGSGTVTLSATSTFTGGTTVSAGTLALGHATNTLADTGAVNVAGGTLSIGGNSDTVGAVTLSAGAITGTTGRLTATTLTASNASSATVSAILAGSTSLSKTGAGALLLSGANTHAGGTTVSAGELQLGGASVLGAGALTLNGGALASSSDTARTVANAVTVGGNVTLGNASNTGALTFSGSLNLGGGTRTLTLASDVAVSGQVSDGGLVKAGSGVLTFSGANTHTGGTTVSAGTLSVTGSTGAVSLSSGARLRGTGSVGALTLANGATVEAGIGGAGSLSVGNVVLDASAQAVFQIASADAYASQAAFSAGSVSFGAGSQVLFSISQLADAGTYRLMTYAGSVDPSRFALSLPSTSLRRTDVLNFETPGVINYVVAGFRSVWRGATPDFSAAGAWMLGAPTTFQAGDELLLDDTAASGQVTLTAVVSPTLLEFTGDTLSYNLGSSGGRVAAGSLAKSGASELTITAANTYAGGTTLSAGAIRVGHDAALGTGLLTLAGGALSSDSSAARTLANPVAITGNVTLGGASARNGVLVLAGPADLGGGTRTLNILSDVTLAGAVANGGVAKQGAGRLALTGEDGFAGDITVSQGTLSVGDGGLHGSVAGAIVNNGALIFDRATNLVHAGAISGAGTFEKRGSGTLTLTGVRTFTGDATVSAGTLLLDNAHNLAARVSVASGAILALDDGATVSGAVTVASGGTLRLDDAVQVTGLVSLAGSGVGGLGALRGIGNSSVANAITLAGDTTIASHSGTLTVQGVSGSGRHLTLAGDYYMSLGALSLGSGSLTVAGAVSTLRAAGAYSGGTFVEGGIVNVAHADALGSGSLTASGGTVEFDVPAAVAQDFNLTGGRAYLRGALQVGGKLLVDGGSLYDAVAGVPVLTAAEYDLRSGSVGVALAGSVGVSKTTAGTVILRQANTYVGETHVHAGTLYLYRGTLGGDAAGTVVHDGASLHLGGADALGAETITISGDGADGKGALVNVGSSSEVGGLVTLAADARINNRNAYHWLTLASVSGQGFDLTFGKLTAPGSSDGHFSVGSISLGSGSLTMEGSGVLELTGPNTYTGGTRVLDGQLRIRHAEALGAGAVVVDGGTLAASSGSGQPAPKVDLARNALDLRSGAVTAAITGSASPVVKTTSGTLTLSSGLSDYTSLTEVRAGTLAVTNVSALGSAAAGTSVWSGATLELAVHRATLSEGLAFQGGARLVHRGSATVAGEFVASGSVAVDSDYGTLTLSGTAMHFSAADAADRRLTVGGAWHAVLARDINTGVGQGAVELLKQGSGTLYTAGARTVNGTVRVAAGELSIGGLTSDVGATLTAPVHVGAGGSLQGVGTILGTVTLANREATAPGSDVYQYAVINPGVRSLGTLTLGGLVLEGSGKLVIGRLDQYGTHAALVVAGGMTFADGPASVIQLGVSGVANGAYRLIEYSGDQLDPGALGSRFSLLVSGLGTRRAGQLGVEVAGSRRFLTYTLDGDSLEWVGDESGGLWSATSNNWRLSKRQTRDDFDASDEVVFGDGGVATAVTLSGSHATSLVRFVNSAGKDYVLSGGGTIASGRLTKQGSGELTLRTANGLAAAAGVEDDGVGFELVEGTVRVGSDNALGGYSRRMLLRGGRLALDQGQPGSANWTLASGLEITSDSVRLGEVGASGRLTIAGAANLDAIEELHVDSEVALAGSISGLRLSKLGAGRLVLGGQLTLAETFVVQEGVLEIGNGFGSTADILNASVVDLSPASGVLTLGRAISGSGLIRKTGVGKVILAADTQSDAGIDVQQGSVVINAAHTGEVFVAQGAVLGGSGAVNGLVFVAGTHAPGNSPGNPSYTQLFYASGATVQWQLAANAALASAAGVDFDQVDVSGALLFDGPVAFTLDFSQLRADGTGGVDWTDTFWNSDQEWLIYDLGPSASTVGGFENLHLLSSNWQDASGRKFADFLSFGSFALELRGNDVFLAYSAAAIPEPSTYGLALGGLALALAAIRRRKHG